MAAAEDENLKVFYRAMTTEQLVTYRAALGADLQRVRKHPWRAQHTATFAQHRLRLIAEILTERGVEART